MRYTIGNIVPSTAKNGNRYIERPAGKYAVGDTFEWVEDIKERDPAGRGRRATIVTGARKYVFTITGLGNTFAVDDPEHPYANGLGIVETVRYYGELQTTDTKL